MKTGIVLKPFMDSKTRKAYQVNDEFQDNKKRFEEILAMGLISESNKNDKAKDVEPKDENDKTTSTDSNSNKEENESTPSENNSKDTSPQKSKTNKNK